MNLLMSENFEIGIGRQARRTYQLSDINIVPSRRTRSSKEVDTSWKIDAYQFDIPLMTHPSDAVVSPASAAEFARLGGLAVLNAEGIWARHEDADEKIAQLRELAPKAEENFDFGASTRRLQELHQAPINHELLTARIREIRDTGAVTAVRVSPQHARDLAPVVIGAGIDLLIIQGTLISAEHVTAQGEPLNLKDFIGGLDVPVIAGGVVNYQTAMHLMRTGAAGIIVGPGNTYSSMPLGIEVPMATAIADAAAARKDYLDETGGRYVHIIADGGIFAAGDIARAIACGADAVAVSDLLANSQEAPGQGFFWPSVAAHPTYPRGLMAATSMPQDGVFPSLEQVLYGPSDTVSGELNLVGGLRRSMAKCGYTNVKSFQRVDLSVRPTFF